MNQFVPIRRTRLEQARKAAAHLTGAAVLITMLGDGSDEHTELVRRLDAFAAELIDKA